MDTSARAPILPARRVAGIAPGTLRATGLDLWLATDLGDGLAIGVSDPGARVGGLVHLLAGFAAGRHVVADLGHSLDTLIGRLAQLGAERTRMQIKCVACDGRWLQATRRELDARGLGLAGHRHVPGPCALEYGARSGLMRTRPL